MADSKPKATATSSSSSDADRGTSKNKKTVLITGCSEGGIGSALALEFHSRGHTVFATARDVSKMSHLAKLDGITLLQMDVLSPPSVAAAAEAVRLATGGDLDILVNNAGVGRVMPLLHDDVASFWRVLETNILGVVRATQAFLPLLSSSDPERKGMVVLIGSTTSVMPPPFNAAYAASKAAVNALADSWRVEFLPLGIRVVNVVTGPVSAQLMKNLLAGKGQGHDGDPAERIPDGSVYAGMRELATLEHLTASVPEWMAADEYARRVVADLLGRGKLPPVLWHGPQTTLARIVRRFAPHGFLDRYMIKAFKGDEMAPRKVESYSITEQQK